MKTHISVEEEKKKIDALWEDLNAPTKVSTKAATRSTKYLESLTSKKKQSKNNKNKKRVPVHEFKMTVLGLDPKRQRKDIQSAAEVKTIHEVVKFAGKEYR
jgi:hypothetical protein